MRFSEDAHTNDGSGHHGLAATPRSKGALTGFLLMALGVWGALIPFIGTYFSFAYTPTAHWTMTSARFFLEVAPGVVAFVGGLLLLGSGNRISASLGGYLAAAAGAWFVVGPVLAPLYRVGYLGHPTGDRTRVALEQITFFSGLGAAIVLLAAFALGRFSVVGVRDVRVGRKRAERRERGNGPDAAAAARPAGGREERSVDLRDTAPADGAERQEDRSVEDSAARKLP